MKIGDIDSFIAKKQEELRSQQKGSELLETTQSSKNFQKKER